MEIRKHLGRWTFLGIAFFSVRIGATENILPEYASYFSSGVQDAYFSHITILEYMSVCVNREDLGCKRNIDASVPQFDWTLSQRRLVTVFGALPKIPDEKSFQSFGEIMPVTVQRRNDFVKQLVAQEVESISRTEAVLKICPGGNSAVSLPKLREVNFSLYWQLPAADLQKIDSAINEKVDTYRKMIVDEHWSDGRCAKTRDFGLSLLELIRLKVEPYLADSAFAMPPNQKFVRGIDYIWKVGMAFEASAHPAGPQKTDTLRR